MIIKAPADDGFYYIRYDDLGRMPSGLFLTAFYIKGGIVGSYSTSVNPSDRLAQAKIDLAKHGVDLSACFLTYAPISEILSGVDVEWMPMTS